MHLFIVILISFLIPSTTYAYEGAGLLVSDQQGALPKALWRDQPRSEIAYLIKNMPADSNMVSAQSIKRNLLLSYYDTSLIKDDVDPSPKNDLLTLRLEKLFEMGFWEDALKLYTKNVADPGDNEPLARIGILLTLSQRGISTICLEEKVIGDRFKEKSFWKNLAAICEREIYETTDLDFSDSSVLQAVYHNNDFQIPASDIGILRDLSALEQLMLLHKKRINLTTNLPESIPPFILKLYLSEPSIDESTKSILQKKAYDKALSPANLPENKQKDEEISPEDILRAIAYALKYNLEISDKTLENSLSNSTAEDKNTIILQLVKKVNSSEQQADLEKYNFNDAQYNFNNHEKEILNYLTESLDKSLEFSNNRRKVYEKHIGLTSEDDYGMSKGSWQNWLNDTTNHEFAGLTLLIVLSNLDNFTSAEENNKNSGDKTEKQKVNLLKSLGNVGLNNQVQKIAREILADLMIQ